MPTREWNPSFATFTLEDNPVMNLTERIDAAIERASKNMPGAWVNQLDPEMVLGECKRRIETLESAMKAAIADLTPDANDPDVFVNPEKVRRHLKKKLEDGR